MNEIYTENESQLNLNESKWMIIGKRTYCQKQRKWICEIRGENGQIHLGGIGKMGKDHQKINHHLA